MEERVLVVAMSGMNDEAGRFIDDQQILVFINDIEGDIFRGDREVMRLVIEQHLDDIAGFDAVVGRNGTTIHPHVACVRSRLDAVSAGVGHVLGKVFVDTLLTLALIDLAAPAFK